jgi:hypothetical protein
MCVGLLQCVASVPGEHDAVPATFQRQLQRPSVLKIIVDEQYGRHGTTSWKDLRRFSQAPYLWSARCRFNQCARG